MCQFFFYIVRFVFILDLRVLLYYEIYVYACIWTCTWIIFIYLPVHLYKCYFDPSADEMLSPALPGVDGSSGDQESAGQPVGPQSDGHLGGAVSPGKQQRPGS